MQGGFQDYLTDSIIGHSYYQNQSAQEFQEQPEPDPRTKGDRHVSGIAEVLLYGCSGVWLVCHDTLE